VSWKRIEQRLLQSKRLSDPVVWLLFLWVLFIVYATLLPFDFSASADMVQMRVHRIWSQPLKGGSWADVQGNVLLFVPLGLLLATAAARRGAGFIVVVFLCMCTGALLSGSVEVLQLFAPSRTSSFIDLVTNSFGATVGAIIGWPWQRLVWPVLSVRLRQLITSRPLGVCAVAIGTAFFMAGLSPYLFRLGARDVKAATHRAQLIPFGRKVAEPIRSAKPLNWTAELLAWSLAGSVFALAARESRVRGAKAVGSAVGASVILCLAIETCQLMIPARDVDMTSIVLALLGSAAGAAVVMRLGESDARRFIEPAIAIWFVAALCALWNPPQFGLPEPPYWRMERVVPFWSYFFSRGLADLADVIGQVLIFIPLGALLAARTNRQTFVWTAVIGLLLGVVVETGQAFLPGRTADISDAISAAGGAAVGFAVWRSCEWMRNSSVGAMRYRIGRPTALRS
jgi:glycopeptide antibiotics resistance protein